MFEWVLVCTKLTPFIVQCGKVICFSWPWKRLRKDKVKTTALVHNFIILANCWNHDQRSMWNGSMSYGVHKVTPPPFMWPYIVECVWENSKFLWPCKKVKITGLLHNFVIMANCWNHVIEGQYEMVQWVMVSTKWPPFMVQYGKIINVLWPWKSRDIPRQ